MGQPIIILNKPGGTGAVAGNELYKRKPDGYTIGMFNSNQPTPELSLNPAAFVYKTGDLVAVAQFMAYPFAFLTRYDAPWKTLEEFAKYGKEHPGQLSVGHNGKGGLNWIYGMLIAQKLGIKMRDVPFQGGVENHAAVLGGHIDSAVTPMDLAVVQHEQNKGMRVLCVLGADRFFMNPDVRTIDEIGYPLGIPEPYMGVFVRKGTPPEIIKKLDDTVKKATESAEVKSKMQKLGMVIRYRNSNECEEFARDYGKVIYNLYKTLGVL